MLVKSLFQFVFIVILELFNGANFLNSDIRLFNNCLEFSCLSFFDQQQDIGLFDFVGYADLNQRLAPEGSTFCGGIMDLNSLVKFNVQEYGIIHNITDSILFEKLLVKIS